MSFSSKLKAFLVFPSQLIRRTRCQGQALKLAVCAAPSKTGFRNRRICAASRLLSAILPLRVLTIFMATMELPSLASMPLPQMSSAAALLRKALFPQSNLVLSRKPSLKFRIRWNGSGPNGAPRPITAISSILKICR